MDPPTSAADFRPEGRRRGRPRRDPLEALRARVWYWHVKVASGWTDYRLNEHFGPQSAMRGPGEAQRKVFERIRRLGVVPRDDVWLAPGIEASAGGLVDRVEQYAPCVGTEAVFRSDFWLLMKRPSMRLPKLKELIHSLCWTLGMMRPSHEQIWNHKRKDLIGGETQAYHDGIKQVSGKNSLDSAALLGALYKEALWFGETEIATLLKTAFIQMIMTYSERFETHIEDPNIAPFADKLRSDMRELFEQAMRHIIFTAGNTNRGDHAEVMYPLFAIAQDECLPFDV